MRTFVVFLAALLAGASHAAAAKRAELCQRLDAVSVDTGGAPAKARRFAQFLNFSEFKNLAPFKNWRNTGEPDG